MEHLDGLSIVAGYEEEDTSTVAGADEKEGATAAVNYATGALKLVFKRNTLTKVNQEQQVMKK